MIDGEWLINDKIRTSIDNGSVSAFNEIPILSKNTSFNSLSSGLRVAIKMGLQGYFTLIPSRSTMTKPSVTACNIIVTKSSSTRLISSTYKIPRCELAMRPGVKTVSPVSKVFFTSTEPNKRSSMTFTGTCIEGGIVGVC